MSEENKETQVVYGIFNKHNGVLFQFEHNKQIAYSYNQDNFLIKEITLKPGEYFFGDYDTGKVYLEEVKPLIREDQMEEDFYNGILKDFSIVKQLLTIMDVLDANKNIIKTEQFDEFIKYLKNKRFRYNQSLEVVKNDKVSFNFISLEDIDEIAVKRMQGIT
jgi:hypothetical protein